MKTTIALLLSAFCLLPSAWADLSAVVQPGYVFGPSERPSTATLNRLGNPTITITGTVGGTNASVAAGSINGTHFSDTVADGTNITFNTASPRALTLVAGGVDVTQISTNLAGNGLGGGGGTNLYLKIEPTNGLAIAGDQLTLSNVPLPRLNVTSNYVVMGTTNNVGMAVSLDSLRFLLITNRWVSFTYPISTWEIANTNHPFGAAPAFIRWVLVCTNVDETYVVGDEIDVLNVTDGSGNNQFSSGANSSNVWINAGPNVSTPTVKRKDGTAIANLNPGDWLVKCYAQP